MVLVTPSPSADGSIFEAEVVILHHPTTIKERYEPVIHCRTVRQSAIVVSMSKSLLRTGQSAKVLFKFSHHPEFITVGSQSSSEKAGRKVWVRYAPSLRTKMRPVPLSSGNEAK